jgi:hypothetical protein
MEHATNIDVPFDFDFANNTPERIAETVYNLAKLRTDFGLEIKGYFLIRINLFEENQLDELMEGLKNQPDELSQYLLTRLEDGHRSSTIHFSGETDLPPTDGL